MEMILRERSCRGNNISRENLRQTHDKKRNKKTPSGTEDLSPGRDSTASEWKADNSKTNRGSLSDC